MNSSTKMRRTLSLIAFVALAFVGSAGVAGSKVTSDPPGTDRPGGDFAHHAQSVPGAQLCASECLFNQRCTAYSYVKPGVQGPQAVCWLKASTPPPVHNSCCTSGKKGYLASNFKPHKPVEIPPPESPNKQFCSMANYCPDHKGGHWNSNTNMCECTPVMR